MTLEVQQHHIKAAESVEQAALNNSHMQYLMNRVVQLQAQIQLLTERVQELEAVPDNVEQGAESE